METSIFMDKDLPPDQQNLQEALGSMFPYWMEIRQYTFHAYPQVIEEWNRPAQKYGWCFRIKDKKRAIVYLLPRDGYFLVAFVYGERAVQDALGSIKSETIKLTIESATKYAEGRGFRIAVRDSADLEDIKKLVDIKLKY